MQLKKFLEQTNGDPKSSYYQKIAMAESGGNDRAVNPAKGATASGKYQFVASTWKGMVDKYKLGYSLDDRFNPEKSQKVMDLFTKENEQVLKKTLGRDPNFIELYSAHFLGAGGGSSFLKQLSNNPNKLATDYFSGRTLTDNKGVMYDSAGNPRTLKGVYDELGRRLGETDSQQTVVATPEVEEKLTDLHFTNNLPNFEGLTLSDEETASEDEKVVVQAEKELQKEDRKLNAFDNFQAQQAQLQQLVPQQAQELNPYNAIQAYSTIAQFVDAPLMQRGGEIPSSPNGLHDFPRQVVNVPTDGSITMDKIDYPVLGISNQTGEKQLMFPGMQYFFDSTNSVTEIPLTIENK